MRSAISYTVRRTTLIAIGALLAIGMASAQARAESLRPARLRCEYREDPQGVDEAAPRLAWIVESSERGDRQTAYHILVASSADRLAADEGDLWDSGRIESDRTIHVEYAGKQLAARQVCHWKVRVWDKDAKPSAWSPAAQWSMGLLGEPWSARYVSHRDETPVFKDPNGHFLPAAQQYRREFRIDKPVRRATVYATALGVYELSLNGRRIGDALFAPGWTDYHQRAYYNTYDVTPMVQRGANAVGAWVADGWYSGYLGFGLLTGIGTERIGRDTYGKTPAFMAQIEIEYQDGTRDTVVTDATWKVFGKGPIRQADFLMGEYYDARMETPGWTAPGFDDGAWPQAILAEDNGSVAATFYEFRNPTETGEKLEVKGRPVDLGFRPPKKLEAFPGVPVRAIEEIRPIAITSPQEGVHIFNLGQNFAGVARLKVKGPAGTVVRMRFGEMLHPDGRLMTENLRKARAHDYYVLAGNPQGETYTPRFTFHGFQYVELTGYPGTPDKDAVTGIVLHSDTPLVSTFECSDPMVNRLFKNIVWTQRANFLDLPTDCPQRDERFGWTGDAQAYVRSATYNADTGAFYTKWLRELMESQRPSGTFPGYAPYPFQHGWDFGSAWCDAGVICPWTIWQVYGDTRIIDQCWEPMTRFMAWRQATSRDNLGVAHGNEWGDWLSQGENTPLEYVDTVYFAYTAHLMADMARATGRDAEAQQYAELFDRIAKAFNGKYLRADGSLAVDTQTAYALALFANLVPRDHRKACGARLAEKIAANGHRMATGFLGTRPLLPVLSSVGQNDLAVRLLQSRSFPSWGYEIEQGATTIWERWDSYTKEDGFGRHNAAMNSFSHYAFGAVCEWMFSTLVGIDTEKPGFGQLVIRPMPPSPGSNPDHKPIEWVRASYDSIRGPVAVAWKRSDDHFELDVTVPANASATVLLPTSDAARITESGQPLETASAVRLIGTRGDRAALAIASGTYRFKSPWRTQK
jgi:alpha-L-rhamnosidase